MTYEYDAFFSYKRDPETDEWHEKVKTKLEHWLHNELNRDAKIFFDTENITTGMRWREKISEALLHSRCMIGVWSPRYFQSEFCIAEWQSFEKRSNQFDVNLIIPARFHDGEHFPEDANKRQLRDFREYALTMEAFWNTTRAVDFEADQLKPFAEDIAHAVTSAPEFSNEFPLIETPLNERVLTRSMIKRPADA